MPGSSVFSTGIDTFVNPTGSDLLSDPTYDHAQMHTLANDAIEGLQHKVGVDGSAVITSLDYLLKHTDSIDPGHVHSGLRSLDNSADAITSDNDGVVTIPVGLKMPSLIPGAVLVPDGDGSIAGDPEFVFDGSKSYVGIGLGGPEVNLDVYGIGVIGKGIIRARARDISNAFVCSEAHDGAQAGVMFVKDGTPKWYVFSELTSHEFRISEGAGTTRLAILSGGKTGLGTAAPSWRLTIYDEPDGDLKGPLASVLSNATGTAAGMTLDPTASVGGRAFSLHATGSGSALGAGRLGIYDHTAAAYRAVMDSSGNLALYSTASPGAKLDLGAGGVRLAEIADPSAPAADSGIVYIRDNGGGKSQLCVRFATGAVQVIATEP